MTPGDSAWRSRAKPLLGTLVELSLRSVDEAQFASVTNRMFDRVAQFHRLMSFHEHGSDLQSVARAAAGERVRVAHETWSVLEAALAFGAESGGAFDCGVGLALVESGVRPAPETRLQPASRSISAQRAIRLDAGDIVTVLQPIWIDLGGIAKGAAVDAALAVARDAGVEAALVDAGGDMAMYGAHDRTIAVRGPNGVRVDAGRLGDGALATSGPFGAADRIDDRKDHVVTVADAARWADRSVTVIAPNCQTADALTKVVIALGRDAAPLLARHGAQAFSIDAQGLVDRVTS